MARALIVGCGCRGRALAQSLLEAGWQVRGTTRRDEGAAAIEAAGVKAAIADPAAVGTVVDQIEGVAIVYWLLGSATGPDDAVRALHSERLERLLEEVVDTPVRGIVYEGAGTAASEDLAGGAEIVTEASARWRIPAEVVLADPADWEPWRVEMLRAGERALGL